MVSNKGAPFPPYYFQFIYLNDVDSLAEGCRARSRAFPVLKWPTCCLLLIFPSHPLITTSCRLCLTNLYTKQVLDSKHTKIWGDMLQLQANLLPPLCFDGTRSSPTQTPSNNPVLCAPGRPIWRLTQLCDHSWLVLLESSNSSRVMTLLTDHTLISGSSKLAQSLLACMRVRYGILSSYDKQGREMDPLQKGLLTVWKGFLESETPLLNGALCRSAVWPLQLN
jgi:hypothetical protein